VYAVRTTGVYCKPSCASRRPRRENVAFFDTTNEARLAGYRPCRRCHPDTAASDPWVDRIRRSCAYLSNADGHLSLSALAARIGGSPYHLQRNFKRIVGVTPREYADAVRLRKVKRTLRAGGDVTGAMVDAGYGSSSRFYERASTQLGMAPSTYRRGGAGMTIAYATTVSPLGRILVAATARGVCSVTLGGSDAELVAQLRREFPAATIALDRTSLARWTDAIVAHLAGDSRRLELPLDIQATAFQRQVWQALTAIPLGETRTYGDVARAIGRPRAVRAVARACATNPVALAIPCHRVVPASGGVGGYRWGAARKETLLGLERRERPEGREGQVGRVGQEGQERPTGRVQR
jgi:AraC family transcriptional regulator of adaptative response/methylated-DNA-[protein]-cysteine methyltransferase